MTSLFEIFIWSLHKDEDGPQVSLNLRGAAHGMDHSDSDAEQYSRRFSWFNVQGGHFLVRDLLAHGKRQCAVLHCRSHDGFQNLAGNRMEDGVCGRGDVSRANKRIVKTIKIDHGRIVPYLQDIGSNSAQSWLGISSKALDHRRFTIVSHLWNLAADCARRRQARYEITVFTRRQPCRAIRADQESGNTSFARCVSAEHICQGCAEISGWSVSVGCAH